MAKSTNQAAADKRWIEKNRTHVNYLRARVSARSFIRTKATQEDLEDLKKLIIEREKTLSEETKSI